MREAPRTDIPLEGVLDEPDVRAVPGRDAIERHPRKGLPVSAWIGIIIIAINAFAAIFGPWLAPYGEAAVVGDVWAPPSAEFWLGTDSLGRDMLSRLLHGAQTSIAIALAITLLSFTIGVTL